MAKWWLLNVRYPEGVTDVLQIYADTPELARSGAASWLKFNSDRDITIRDSSDSPFSNPVITSSGIQKPLGVQKPLIEKPPVKPPSQEGPPDFNQQLPPEDQLKAQLLRGLAMQLHQGASDLQNSIAGRGALARSSDYANVFRFQNQLAGNPAGSQSDPMALQSFASNTNPQMLAQEALRAFRVLSGQQDNAVPGAQTAPWQKTYSQPTDQSASYLASLAAQALQSRYSPLALANLNLPTGEELRTRWLAETGGGPQTNFIQYLRDNFPLMAGI